jgi:hypothetical protein
MRRKMKRKMKMTFLPCSLHWQKMKAELLQSSTRSPRKSPCREGNHHLLHHLLPYSQYGWFPARLE